MAKLVPGEKAPDFSLPDQNGKTVKLSDFQGRKLLLYFYPKADTPGCTTQSCAVRDAREELAGFGVETVGVSPDPPARQKAFDGKFSLGFSLLSDPDHEVAARYGAWGEKKNAGKASQGIIRSSFLIDESGLVVEASYAVKPEDTVPKAMAALE
jgi:peroxiredoxin Q/BCP